jgi:diguanylate cyclase (GGDEF)-like protein
MASTQIILVEDDASVARLIQIQFQREGYDLRLAGSLAEARRRLSEGPWDVLLLDRNLPDGDGIDLCHEIRSTHPHGYIVMLTGMSSRDEKLAGFGCGADDYVTKPFVIDELLARVRAGLRIVELQKALLATNRRLEELSRTDPLTALRNRRAFDTELASRFEHARRYARPLTLAMIDVDHFKRINDTYGHPAGDAVLRCVADILRKCSRQSDFVARYGGEEFAILLPETALFESLQFAEKIRAEVATASMGEGMPERVTISVGLASTPHTLFATAAELVAAADEALYRAKEKGRNRVECERRAVTKRAPYASRAMQV